MDPTTRRNRNVLIPAFEELECRQLFSSFVVTNTLDFGTGSLRQAIVDANASGGKDTIAFNIGAGGLKVITPGAALPDITDPVVIDGATQPRYAGEPLVQLDGLLTVIAGSSTIRGLCFAGDQSKLLLKGGSGNTVIANYFGILPDDSAGSGIGLSLDGSSNNIIGGTNASDRNVISAQQFTIANGSNGNVVRGNYIGTYASGTNSPRRSGGLSVDHSSDNTIGGTQPGAGNLISGNVGNVWVNASDRTTIQGNLIGTDVTGTRALSTHSIGSVDIFNSDGVVVGGTAPLARNVISGDLTGGMFVSDISGVIQGNFIGTDITGTQPLNNARGIVVEQLSHDHRQVLQIGGTETAPEMSSPSAISRPSRSETDPLSPFLAIPFSRTMIRESISTRTA